MSSVEVTFVKVEEFEGLKRGASNVHVVQVEVATHRSEDARYKSGHSRFIYNVNSPVSRSTLRSWALQRRYSTHKKTLDSRDIQTASLCLRHLNNRSHFAVRYDLSSIERRQDLDVIYYSSQWNATGTSILRSLRNWGRRESIFMSYCVDDLGQNCHAIKNVAVSEDGNMDRI